MYDLTRQFLQLNKLLALVNQSLSYPDLPICAIPNEKLHSPRSHVGPWIEISASPKTRDLLFFGWACRISENFSGKGPDFKEMGVGACL